MVSPHSKSVTLIELLIAIALLAVIILGINNINIFSRYHLISSDRRAKLQNDVSRCLEHITKNASSAIGNFAINGSNAVVNTSGGLYVYIDANGNGTRESGSGDRWIGYSLSGNNLNYYADCGAGGGPSCGASPEVVASDITAFTPSLNISSSYIDVTLTACYNPASACGTPDNPSVTMATSITLPSVATN